MADLSQTVRLNRFHQRREHVLALTHIALNDGIPAPSMSSRSLRILNTRCFVGGLPTMSLIVSTAKSPDLGLAMKLLSALVDGHMNDARVRLWAW